jgi:hypothetical protein
MNIRHKELHPEDVVASTIMTRIQDSTTATTAERVADKGGDHVDFNMPDNRVLVEMCLEQQDTQI